MLRSQTSPFWLRGALILSLFALSGCSYLIEEDNIAPPAELVNFDATASIPVAWSRDVGASIGDRYLKLRPMLAGERVLAADHKGWVSAYDVRDGTVVWQTDTDASLSGGPGFGDGLVAVGTSDGEVIALDAASGDIRWRVQLSSEVLSRPIAANGIVIARTIDGSLHGLDVGSGERRWIYDRTVPVLTLRGTSSPALAGGAAITGFDSGRIAAIDLSDGQPRWEAQVAVASGRSELERIVDIDADPIIVNDTVYAVAYQGNVAAFGLESGEVLWQRDISSHAGVAADRQRVYVSQDNSHLWALDSTDARQVWKQELLEARRITAPVVFGDYVAVADFAGFVHFFERESGELAARTRVGRAAIIAAPVVADDTLFVYDSDGELSALRSR